MQPKQVIFPDLKSIEFVCVKISVARGGHVIISGIYRPPNSPRAWLDSFYGLTNNILCDSTACIVLGDFNEDLLRSPQFADKLHSTFGPTQHINKPTRVTEKSATLIDHVYSSGITNTSTEVTELHIADHRAVICTLHGVKKSSINAQKHKTSSYHSLKNVNYNMLSEDLSVIKWKTFSDLNDVNEMVT